MALLGHPSALVGACTALLCAFFAMVRIMSFTFLGAHIADSRAQVAELLGKLAVH